MRALLPSRVLARLTATGRRAAAGGLAAAAGLVTLTAVVGTRPTPTGFDRSVLAAVLSARTPALTVAARVVTTAGSGPVVYAALAAAGLWAAGRSRSPRPLLGSLAALGAGQLVRLALAHAVGRARPPVALRLVGADGPAFPSGHTTSSTIGYGLVAALVVGARRGRRPAAAGIVAGAALLAAAVGLSRVYLGAHWATDVLGGWCLGVAWLAAVRPGLRVRDHGRPGERSHCGLP